MAIGPIDYLGAMPQQDFLRDIQGGLQLGLGIRQAQQAEAEKARALQMQQQYQTEVSQYLAKPTAQGAAALATKYPSNREAILEGWKTVDSQQQKDEITAANEVYAALTNGRTDVATQRIEQRIAALDASGGDSTEEKALLGMLKENPTQATGYLGLVLAQLDDKFAANHAALGQERRAETEAPAKLSKLEAEAQSAATAAKFADSKAAQDLVKGGWEISKLQNDIQIARQNTAIAATNAAIARETNGIKRQENQIKLQELIQKRDTAVREKAAEVESSRASIDNMLNTADRIIATSVDPKTGKPTGVIKAAAGPIDAAFPTFQTDVADLEALVETLGSQAFMAQIPALKGMGALSNAEGEKLQASLQNFSLKQSPERFVENVKEAQRIVMKVRKNLSAKFGVPDSVPDTPAAGAPEADIDALVKKYGGR